MGEKKLEQFHTLLDLFSSPSPSPTSSISNSPLLDFGAEEWEIAEKKVNEILSAIQPTVKSERRRKQIIEYIQILMGASYGIKVFPFGSVPLKTYIPDGDIDLCALSHWDEEALSSIVCSVLEREATMNTEIKVKDVQCVPAQVKVVKCYVEGISVDISFKQIEGLCALSFLEQVDQLIGKGHLFKRSIILIKAWCFYESRLLGAIHGLISTYALETMIAHIINLFHSSLHSPLSVLHKFLAYYSKFDWENHCVAIDGLVPVSSLPEVKAQPPDESDNMLLSADFLQTCRERCLFSAGINQAGESGFPMKFLNVIDPLRGNNNIGRSVNRANFNRIKSSLNFATDNLNAIFAFPKEEISKGIETFFKTTLGRLALVPSQVDGKPEASEPLDPHDSENVLDGIQYGLWWHEFGIYKGCNNSMVIPETWNKCNHLGFAERYHLNALCMANGSRRPTGEASSSRGTGTYIPKPVYTYRVPNEGRRRRENLSCVCKQPEELVYDDSVDTPPPIDITDAEEENEEEMKMVLEDNLTNPPELGDMSEFPPLQGKASTKKTVL